MKYKIISVTPIQHIPDIEMYKVGMIIQKGKEDLRGGNIYNKNSEVLEQYKAGMSIEVEELKETRGGNTIKIKEKNTKKLNFTKSKNVNNSISSNGIEDPF